MIGVPTAEARRILAFYRNGPDLSPIPMPMAINQCAHRKIVRESFINTDWTKMVADPGKMTGVRPLSKTYVQLSCPDCMLKFSCRERDFSSL